MMDDPFNQGFACGVAVVAAVRWVWLIGVWVVQCSKGKAFFQA